ncbi:glycosyltransferase [Thomasclavelia cocleata]|uniref:glycosyltransferase n=1 Tax=Thomasclavelia cocleata TaxID=69824 RepID=UPI0024325791|nr:glycosyltransferase [Thomasclavelia cocleata]
MRCDVIIPIYNAIDCVKECVNSVIKNTDLKENGLILIDDKSPDESVREYLKVLESDLKNINVTILYNETNLGFVGTVNKGMKYSKNDVLLLNSDTEVGPKWLELMKECAYSQENVGSVTALSNNATLVSVPIGLQANELPSNMSFEEYAILVQMNSLKKYPELPTAHGFCMYIRRDVLDNVGYFDAKTFGKGYGEENDFSYRCMEYGYKHLLCDEVIVYHKESQSFSESKTDLINNNLKILAKRYPAYVSKTDMWLKRFPLKNICQNINYSINQYNRKNILFVVHDWSNIKDNIGGTTLHCYDLIERLREHFNIHVLAPEGGLYKIYSYFKTGEEELKFDSIMNNVGIANLYSKEYESMVEKIVDGLDIDVVHVHHMIGHYFDILDVAKSRNIKTIYTVHDFYCLCPSINMLYNMEQYCLCIDKKDCTQCLKNKLGISNNIINLWKVRWENYLEQFDEVLTPSKSTKEILQKEYTKLHCKDIEHGINIHQNKSNLTYNGKMNVAFVGVMAKHKGAEIVQDLIKIVKDSDVSFHLFGDSEYQGLKKSTNNYIYHGKYKREELPQLLADNNINLVCNLSIWPETYSYTLTETISCGVPVLSYNVGAVAERIEKYGFGWTVPLDTTTKDLGKFIVSLKNDQLGYEKVINDLNAYKIKTVDDMIEEYLPLYDIEYNHENNLIGELICLQSTESINPHYVNIDEILNSRRWKLVSRIQLPESMKKIVRKIIK